MDVHCSTCGEPWDTYHLWHDAIAETGLSEDEIRAWEKLPQNEKLAPKWREGFEMARYVFGRTVINVIRCPACPKDAQPAAVPAEEIQTALLRHHNGDWGDVCEGDRQENERSLREGLRLLSVFHTKTGVKFYIITEHDRSATTVLLPDEY